jgi:hypothetical protein
MITVLLIYRKLAIVSSHKKSNNYHSPDKLFQLHRIQPGSLILLKAQETTKITL